MVLTWWNLFCLKYSAGNGEKKACQKFEESRDLSHFLKKLRKYISYGISFLAALNTVLKSEIVDLKLV